MNTKIASIVASLAALTISASSLAAKREIPPVDPRHAGRARAGGGAGVGNYSKTYVFVRYGFAISFNSSLELHELSPEHVTIDNIAAAGDDASSVEFEVLKGSGVKTLEDLKKLAESENPSRKFATDAMKGAQSLVSEQSEPGRLDAIYYLLIVNGDAIRAHVTAVAAADGIALVAPIVRTFAYDVTPPVIRAVDLPRKIQAGQTARLRVKVTDDVSGVVLRPTVCAEFSGIERVYVFRGCGRVLRESADPDWYRFDFSPGKFIPAGTYQLTELMFADAADNYVTDLNDLPVAVRVELIASPNQASDTQAPIYRQAKLPRSVRAGQDLKVRVRLTDDVSGVNPAFGGCIDMEPLDSNAGASALYGCGKLVREKADKDWYTVTVPVSKYAVAGSYKVDRMGSTDFAGNTTGSKSGPDAIAMRIITIKPAKDQLADSTPPEIEQVELSSEVRAGAKLAVRARVTDDRSGVVAASTCAKLQGLDVQYEIQTCAPFVRESKDSDWYRAEFEINAYSPAGTYRLLGLLVIDAAGNAAHLGSNQDAIQYMTRINR